MATKDAPNAAADSARWAKTVSVTAMANSQAVVVKISMADAMLAACAEFDKAYADGYDLWAEVTKEGIKFIMERWPDPDDCGNFAAHPPKTKNSITENNTYRIEMGEDRLTITIKPFDEKMAKIVDLLVSMRDAAATGSPSANTVNHEGPKDGTLTIWARIRCCPQSPLCAHTLHRGE